MALTLKIFCSMVTRKYRHSPSEIEDMEIAVTGDLLIETICDSSGSRLVVDDTESVSTRDEYRGP